jgi:branched-chain amino acid transport system substrate-binding protein
MNRTLAVGAMLAIVLALVGGSAAPIRGAEPAEIVVGSILPLTGGLATTGQGLKLAQELARDLINGKQSYPLLMAGKDGLPNLGHAKLKIIFADSQGSPDQAKTVAEQLITQDHVVALLGTYASATTATASQVAERYGIPFVNPDSSNPTLHTRGFKTFFRTTPHDATFSENLFEFMSDVLKKQKKPPVHKLAIVYENTLFGTGAADAEEAIAKRDSYDVALRLPYGANSSELQSEVQKIKAAGGDVIFQSSYLNDALLFMKTYKQQSVSPQAIIAQDAGFIDPNFVKNLGKDADYIFTRDVFSLNLKAKNKAVPAINELFKARSPGGNNLDGNTARDFTAVFVLADAINRARSTKPEEIIKALAATNIKGSDTIMPWRGIKFDEHGQNTLGNGLVEQIQNGIYETVWPFDVATKPAIWPMPPWDKR